MSTKRSLLVLKVTLASLVTASIIYGVYGRKSPRSTRVKLGHGQVEPSALSAANSGKRHTLVGERLHDVLERARRQIETRRPGFRPVRLYATGVRRDGTLGTGATVSLLFASRAASKQGQRAGISEGVRWEFRSGRVNVTDAAFSPPASDIPPTAKLCRIETLLKAPNAPDVVTVDLRFARQGKKLPSLALFSTSSQRWLLVVDPETCEAKTHSTAMTEQERNERRAEQQSSGKRVFDSSEAMKAIRGAMVRLGTCTTGADARGPKTIRVVFNKRGRVVDVVLSGNGWETKSGPDDCLPRLLSRIRIRPWDEGVGEVTVDWQAEQQGAGE